MRGADRVDARLWSALVAWCAAAALVQSTFLGTNWHYFSMGSGLLVSTRAVHLYVLHPELQIGPVSFVLALPFAALGHLGTWLVCLSMAAAGPVLLWSMTRLASSRPVPWSVAAAGLPFLLTWTQLSMASGHLDDVLAICFSVAALHLLDRHPARAAALLALAADSKPWALGFAVLLLVPARRQPSIAVVWAAVVAAAWLPFFLGDPGTVPVLSHFSIPNAPTSALRFFGVDDARTPTWDRSVQLGVSVLLAGLATLRGRPAAVLLVVLSVRMLLDPGTQTYFNGSLLAAAALYDLAGSRRTVPVATLGAFVFVYLPHFLRIHHAFDHVAGGLRAAFLISVLLDCLLGGRSDGRAAPIAEASAPGRGVAATAGVPGGGPPSGAAVC